MTACRLGAGKHRADAAGHRDVVVLDQHRVIEPEAVIEAAAAAHGVFLQRPQPGRGLARADDARLGMGDAPHEFGRAGGDAGEVAEEIQRGTLCGQDGAGVAGNRHQAGPGLDRHAVAAVRLDLDLGRQPAECHLHQRQAGDHTRLARNDGGAAPRVLRHRRGRSDITGASKVLFERARHRGFDFERRDKGVGAKERHWGNP